MNGHHAPQEIANTNTSQVARSHRFGNAFLIGIVTEAFQNIAVSGVVSAENPAKQRNNPAKPSKIAAPPKSELRFPKVQNQQTSARPQYADKFVQAIVEVWQVSQSIGNGDPIKAFGGKRKRQSVGLDKAKAGLSLAPKAGFGQHVDREIHSRNRCPLPCQSKSHVASAAANIQSQIAGTNRGQFHQTPFPKPMHPKTLQIVHQVVTRRNPIKKPLYPLGAAFSISSII